MMKRLVSICTGILFSCLSLLATGSGEESPLRFIVVSDVHTSNDVGKMERMASLIWELNEGRYRDADFLLINGDCVSSFLEKREVDHEDPSNNRVLKLMKVLETSEKPVHLAMGNHEYKIDKQKDSDDPFSVAEIDTIHAMWNRYTGLDPYYSFQKGEMKYLVLNSQEARPQEMHFGEKQLDWLEDELADEKPVILFFHHPVKTDHPRIWAKKKDMVTLERDPRFMQLLSEHREQIRGIFVGHGHMWVKDRLYGEIPVYETASFGDAEVVCGYQVSLDPKELKITEVEKLNMEQEP